MELQPATGGVTVRFEFTGGQLTEGLGATEAAEVTAAHLPLAAAAKADTTIESVAFGVDDVMVEQIAGNNLRAEGANVVEVRAYNFSVFAIARIAHEESGQVTIEDESPQTSDKETEKAGTKATDAGVDAKTGTLLTSPNQR